MAILDFLSKPFEPSEGIGDSEFSEWYMQQAKKTGISLNPYAPEHYYDYEAAYEAGAEPTYVEGLGKWKWPSQFKHDLHKDRYIVKDDATVYDTKYEKPAKLEDMVMQAFKRKEYEEDMFDKR